MQGQNDNLDDEAAELESEAITSDEAVPSDAAQGMSEETVDQTSIDEAASGEEAITSEGETLIDGKFKTVADRDNSYRELERKFHEVTGQLSELRRRVENPSTSISSPQEPRYKQLQSERQKWWNAYRNPSASEEQRAQADEQVRLYDQEIAYERASYDIQQKSTRQSAEQQLETDATSFVQQYASDLNNMGSPLYQAASRQLDLLVRAGLPNTNATKAMAVAYAAIQTKTAAKAAVVQDRGRLLKTLNTAAKKAVVAGAGGQTSVQKTGVSAKDIENMDEKEFAKYERELLGV